MNFDETNRVRGRLRQIAEQQHVRILFACENGSRAWGVESQDSDYDVRFIYMRKGGYPWLTNGEDVVVEHADSREYLKLWPPRDVIEIDDGDLDMVGWDVDKALRLAAKSNPNMVEWFKAPWTYYEAHPFTRAMRDLPHSPRQLMHHYLNMARNQVDRYFNAEEGTTPSTTGPIRLKKYLYVVRPLMCVSWMVKFDYAVPPLDFKTLWEECSGTKAIDLSVSAMLAAKAQGNEDGLGRYPELDQYIVEWLRNGEEFAQVAPSVEPDRERIQRVFDGLFGWMNESGGPK